MMTPASNRYVVSSSANGAADEFNAEVLKALRRGYRLEFNTIKVRIGSNEVTMINAVMLVPIKRPLTKRLQALQEKIRAGTASPNPARRMAGRKPL